MGMSEGQIITGCRDDDRAYLFSVWFVPCECLDDLQYWNWGHLKFGTLLVPFIHGYEEVLISYWWCRGGLEVCFSRRKQEEQQLQPTDLKKTNAVWDVWKVALLWLWLHSPEVLTAGRRLDLTQVSPITHASNANRSIVMYLLVKATNLLMSRLVRVQFYVYRVWHELWYYLCCQ